MALKKGLQQFSVTDADEKDENHKATEKVPRGSCGGFARCNPSMRNPLIEGFKPGNGYAHRLELTEKFGKSQLFQ